MNIRRVRDELRELRQAVEEMTVKPGVVMVPGYSDQVPTRPVVLCQLPGLFVMCDPRDLERDPSGSNRRGFPNRL